MSEGRALELLCADFISGVVQPTEQTDEEESLEPPF